MSGRKSRKNSDTDIPKESLKEKFAERIGVDQELILNVVHVELTGNRELFIENYKGIIEYTDTLIRINTNPAPLKIEGKNLEIKTITQEMLYITGYFKDIGFLPKNV